ncbi:hypothetical protein F5Y15DRAFT_417670 [Xylariaceae sp. FL0016]|nr:hypothetical protein F5Y15DRAFT_417670 [Xylariaceae sp. FL0016]
MAFSSVIRRSLIRPLPSFTHQTFPIARTFTASALLRGPLAEAIKAGHHELKSYHPHLTSHKDVDERVRYQNLFTWELARQAVAQDIVIYPAMDDALNEGVGIAKKSRAQSQKIKEHLHTFQSLSPTDPAFDDVLASLWDDLSQHIEEVEGHDIPALEAELSDQEATDLRISFDRTKMLAPTRSHPGSPGKPPFETVAALLAAPLDKVMDVFRKFPQVQNRSDPNTHY